MRYAPKIPCMHCGEMFPRQIPSIKKAAIVFCSYGCRAAYGSRKALVDFWRRTEFRNGCWEWTGAKNADGYGLTHNGLAHRAVWEREVGPIPDGMKVCHSCDNRACVFRGHLFLGTQEDNVYDMFAKDRYARLPDAKIAQIRAAKGSYAGIAKVLGVGRSSVKRYKECVTRRRLRPSFPTPALVPKNGGLC